MRYLDQVDKTFIIVIFLLVAASMFAANKRVEKLEVRIKQLEATTVSP